MFLQKAWRTAAFGVFGYLNFTKSAFIEHSKKFKEDEMKIRIDGKNCVVTGANSGIGYAAAEALASRGGNVYMVCRNKERGEAAVSKVQSATGNQNVYLEVCDLSSISDIKSCASRFISKEQPVHILEMEVRRLGHDYKDDWVLKIYPCSHELLADFRVLPPLVCYTIVNNAGLIENKRTTTPEGLEVNFAVNVAGTFCITELMLPLLEKATPDARVITVSSGGMYTSPLTADLQFSESKFDGVLQYARNKRVQVALTEKWAELHQNKGIGFYSMHPGWAETPGVAQSLPDFSERMSGKLRTSEEGADTIVWLALQPKEKLVSGSFYFDRAEAPKHLPFAGTSGSHDIIDSIVDRLYSLCDLS